MFYFLSENCNPFKFISLVLGDPIANVIKILWFGLTMILGNIWPFLQIMMPLVSSIVPFLSSLLPIVSSILPIITSILPLSSFALLLPVFSNAVPLILSGLPVLLLLPIAAPIFGIGTVFPMALKHALFLATRLVHGVAFAFFYPIESIVNIIWFLSNVPFKIIQWIGHLPLLISYFFINRILYFFALKVPFETVQNVISFCWNVLSYLTYIPRLPILFLLRLPVFNLIPIIFEMISPVASAVFCSLFDSGKVFISYVLNLPAKILMWPYVIVKFVALLPIRVFLFPLFAIDVVARIGWSLVTKPFKIVYLPIKFATHLISMFSEIVLGFPIEEIWQVVSLPVAWPLDLVSGIIKLLLLPHTAITFIFM